MKKALLVLAVLAAGAIYALQAQKQITLAWDPMPVGAGWAEVRIYDISATPEVLVATAVCQSGTCPTTVTATVQKKAYQFVARSYNGEWESDNSNVVVLPGPPSTPGNLRKQ